MFLCWAPALCSHYSFTVPSTGLRREGEQDTPDRKQITPLWALNTCHERKCACAEKWKQTEVFHEFPQSSLLLLSPFSALISRVWAVTFYHLPPIANVFVAVSARKCVKGCTCYAPVSQLAAHPPTVKEHISWQLPGWIRCDNFHPAAALPSSHFFYLLLLSPARLCWAHTCLNVGQGLLT